MSRPVTEAMAKTVEFLLKLNGELHGDAKRLAHLCSRMEIENDTRVKLRDERIDELIRQVERLTTQVIEGDR